MDHPDIELKEHKSLHLEDVTLCVEKIITYRREVKELPTAMTGELYVVGENTECVNSRNSQDGEV